MEPYDGDLQKALLPTLVTCVEHYIVMWPYDEQSKTCFLRIATIQNSISAETRNVYKYDIVHKDSKLRMSVTYDVLSKIDGSVLSALIIVARLLW